MTIPQSDFSFDKACPIRSSPNGNDRNTGVSFTTPILFYPADWLGLEFRPTWSEINDNNIDDYDLSVRLGRKYLSARAGYRWMEAGDVSLDGPHIGLSIHF